MASRNKNKKRGLESEYISEEEEENKAPSIGEDDKFSSETSQGQDMITSSHHYFGSIQDGFSIRIIENMKEEYGLFVWPSSIILAEYVWQQKSRFSKANVVLGAGTSLPGLVAAKVGAAVTLTDNANRLEVLDNMRRVCNINDVKCRVLGLTWGILDSPVFSLHPNIILGADVLYDTRVFDDLFATVTFLLQKSPDSVFITTITTEVEQLHYLNIALKIKACTLYQSNGPWLSSFIRRSVLPMTLGGSQT
ncbi:Methyltransferase-like protein 23 [Sesamum angolense]|uniref:Methyltransferase-like protein 23 n=1 Tax=Sesamum angolense TaxID=2727404 RepID=A0AAE2C4W3_9LAMI|nr:Methyltransferase-like protein 23 [Sesamum angolense]